MRFSLTLAAAAILCLTVANSADAQFRRGGGGGRLSIGIGLGSGGYGYPGYGYGGGYRSGYGYSPGYRSGISIGLGSGYYGGNYGGYYGGNYGGYGRQSFYQPGISIGLGRGYSSGYRGWQSNSWNWASRPAFWSSYNSASVFGTTGTRVYANPYVSGTPITVGTVNYANPLPNPPATPTVSEEALQPFNEAREAFQKGDYSTALAQVDKAIEKVADDTNLHEFRSLCLFAMKDYKKAAQVIYPVLASGPGWNWETIKSLYGNSETYTSQLRALEDHYLSNKNDPAASFLLAYHYLVLDYPSNAKTHLRNVNRLLPDDKLAPELLKVME